MYIPPGPLLTRIGEHGNALCLLSHGKGGKALVLFTRTILCPSPALTNVPPMWTGS